jgi:adenylate cyclase class 2
MVLEIEAKFLEVNIPALRKILKANGAKIIHKMVMYKRYVFNLLDSKEKGYIRTRDENGKVTITLKKYPANTKFAEEYEILLDKKSTIEDAKNLLLAQGYKIKAFHQTLREKWSLDGCPEIAIDVLPGIPPYVELECKNEKEIKKVAKLLGFNMEDAKYGPYVNQYIDYYGINIDDDLHPNLTFINIDKELKPAKKSQKELLQKLKKDNLNIIKINKIINKT